MDYIKLNNGIEMPMVGFGVFQISDLTECEHAISKALEIGYRLIDTASVYGNEQAVGHAIRKSGIPRNELFITTKTWISEAGYEQTRKAFDASMKRLGLDYLDLYLIHMPFGNYYGSWRAMEELYERGKIRAIGVCNFEPDRLMDLCKNAQVIPCINQIEIHPFTQQKKSFNVMNKLGVQAEAWAPFAEGLKGLFHNDVLSNIGRKYGKTVAQVVLKWHIQRGVIVIPKSVHEERIEENFNIWDFSLTAQELELIEQMDTGQSLILDLHAPEEVERLYNINCSLI